jgi:hypothetical protein
MVLVEPYLDNFPASDPAGCIGHIRGWRHTRGTKASVGTNGACAILTTVQQKLLRVGQIEGR